MEGISILGAFVAGLISFLSPCVLPLVPGYISMLSGIGVEQLKEGKTPRGGLLWSALAFVTGFSVVFISFGASASAVGSFLLRNRASLAPVRSEDAAWWIAVVGARVCHWVFRGLYFLWRIGQRRRIVFTAQSGFARAGRGRFNPDVWSAPDGPADQDFDSCRTYGRGDSCSDRRVTEHSSAHVRRLSETDSLLFSCAHFSAWSFAYALAQSRCAFS